MCSADKTVYEGKIIYLYNNKQKKIKNKNRLFIEILINKRTIKRVYKSIIDILIANNTLV